jgi:hypothetical protein
LDDETLYSEYRMKLPDDIENVSKKSTDCIVFRDGIALGVQCTNGV